jgi:hypothetical protein
MHSQSSAAAAAELDLRAYFDTPANYAHTANAAALVLERLPSGDYAWLRPCTEPAEDDDALYVVTDKGRRDLRRAEAEAWLFGAR